MHGAGYGTCDNSFGDMASDLSSAGFVTAVLDKPGLVHQRRQSRLPGFRRHYDQVINLLRKMDTVDASKVGIYATSESTWISSYLLQRDPDVAFQVLLSPMVYEPRYSLGFLAAQDFALVGAHDGYQSIVRRVFNIDASLFGLTNLDIDTLTPKAYAIPTLVAYGTKDVMTAQVEGTEKIVDLAHQAGNWDVTIRTYPIANHVLRLGDEANSAEPRSPTRTWMMWSTGPSAPRTDCNRPANAWPAPTCTQSIAVPLDLKANRGLTIYLVVLHASMLVLLLVPQACCGSIVLMRKIWARAHGRRYGWGCACVQKLVGHVDYRHYGHVCAVLRRPWRCDHGCGQAGMGQCSSRESGHDVLELAGYSDGVRCRGVGVVRVFMRLIEEATHRGIAQWPPRKGAIGEIVSGRQPVLASTRFGRVMFWLTVAAMFCVLLWCSRSGGCSSTDGANVFRLAHVRRTYA